MLNLRGSNADGGAGRLRGGANGARRRGGDSKVACRKGEKRAAVWLFGTRPRLREVRNSDPRIVDVSSRQPVACGLMLLRALTANGPAGRLCFDDRLDV
jgi:hypothetical protein